MKRRDKKRRMTEVGKWMQQMRSGTINMTNREDWGGKIRVDIYKKTL